MPAFTPFQPDNRMAVQPFCDFHDGSLSDPGDSGTTQTTSGGCRRRLLVVRGHLFYGIHEFLPQGATYITMLREPVVRLLSSYYFILRRPLHPMHRKLKKECLGVEDYIRLTPRRQNLQCDSSPESAMVKLAMSIALHTAKENLSRSFSVIGLCESYSEILCNSGRFCLLERSEDKRGTPTQY